MASMIAASPARRNPLGFCAEKSNSFDLLHHFPDVEYRLRGGERLRGLDWCLALNVRQRIGSHSEALEVGSRDVEVNFIASHMHVEDLVDQL